MNVTKQFALAAAAMMLVLAGCPSEDEKVCSDFCGAGSACVGGTCQAVLTCDPVCAGDETCVNGSCTATVAAACSAGCAADQVCVVADAAASCVDVCGPSQQWNATSGLCEIVVPVCDPACGTGEACQDGACVPTLESACSGGCAADQVCVTATGTATCMDVCGSNQLWNPDTKTCELQIAMDHSRYFGGFSDTELLNGPAVTAQCLNCHSIDAAQMAGSAHFKWLGPTPLLAGHEADTAAVGKKNLINNFCVAVASNEQRCTQCHAGYADPGLATTAGTPAYEMTGAAALARVDCLICHADLSTGYIKHTTEWGKADAAANATTCGTCASTEVCWNDGVTTACVPKTARFKAAAQSVGRPDRANCGWCHFYAGGGDNVKMGDLASSLKAPAMAADVHMGSTATGGQDMACVDCHVTSQHRIFGAGVSVAVSEGRTACSDCHDAAVHPTVGTVAATTKHLAKLACQTCHIPAFSRQLRTKMRWDWRLAGYKDCKFPVTAAEEAAWGDLDTDGDGFADTFPGATCAAISASPSVGWVGADGEHYEYDWRKGVFLKEDNVAPAFRYFDGNGSHLTIADAFTQAGSEADPVVIATPTATSATVGAKIAPFKEMRGTQPGMADGSFLIVPYLYPMKGADGAVVPGALWASGTLPASGMTVDGMLPVWNASLTVGAKKGAQIADADAIETAEWKWVETRMYLNINHEVAPAASARGCTDCHSGGPTGICGMPGVTCTW